jgi:hypothetical protein
MMAIESSNLWKWALERMPNVDGPAPEADLAGV